MKRENNRMNYNKFESIYKKYANDVYRVSLYLTGKPCIAKGITERAFECLYQDLEVVDETHMFAYLVQQVKKYANEAIQSKFKVEEVIE